MECSLVMFKSDGTRLDIPLTQSRMVIGRMSNCDICVAINRVSREHCEIMQDETGLHYKDLNSSNGVMHNGAKSKRGLLKAGDELVIGPVIFTVVIDGKPARISPIRTILDDGVEPEKNGSHAGTLVGETIPEPVNPAPSAAASAPAGESGSPILKAFDIGSSGVSSVPAFPQPAKAPAPAKADELASFEDDFGAAEEVHDDDGEEPAFTFE